MNDLPDTIKHPSNFVDSQWHIECPHCNRIIGFDGIFDWHWVIQGIRDANPESKIMPTDFDGVIERCRHYLVMETKDMGIPIPKGQILTLDKLRHPRSFTTMQIWGKRNPEKIIITWPNGNQNNYDVDYKLASYLVKQWYERADKNKEKLFE
jgi:hypothetical protein